MFGRKTKGIMKKCILAVMAVISCVTFSVASSNSQAVLNSHSVVMSVEPRPVNVYKINASGVVIKTKMSGTFDEEKMILTVRGATVSVVMNTDKGRGRDNFTYKGGSCYYFD